MISRCERLSVSEWILEASGISKSFPGVRALDSVDFALRGGEVHGLVGENGAGKSTLIKILCGVYQPDTGEITVDGQIVTIDSAQDAQRLGITPVHQEIHLVPLLSVAENIFLGRQPLRNPGWIDRAGMERQAAEVLGSLGIRVDVRALVTDLSVAQRQMVSIARALSSRARVIVLDEPTASLSERETTILFEIIRRLKERGVAVIYISHRLEEIFAIADRVTVMRDGHVIGTQPVAETRLDQIIAMMVGRQMSELFRKEEVPIGSPILQVDHLNAEGVLRDISFTLHRGEILGLAGLVGAGRSELARAIFGADRYDQGTVLLEGQPLRARHPRDAVARGIGLAPEDRKQQGLIMGLPVAQNITLANLFRRQRFGFFSLLAERKTAETYVKRLGIRTPDVDRQVVFLSGGNQQRVVIARWLETRPKVLILDEPTQGVDVGAKAEIHGLMVELARAGVGILLISSDLPEVLQMSDRVLVMHEGRITGRFSREQATQEMVMRSATGEYLEIA
jgi:ribose transport system ATP-binding protein